MKLTRLLTLTLFLGLLVGKTFAQSTSNSTLQLTFMCYQQENDSFKWRVRNSLNSSINYTWEINGSALAGSGVAQAGDNFFVTKRTTVSCDLMIIYVNNQEQSSGRKCANLTAKCPPPVSACLNCGEKVGGNGFSSSWERVNISAKGISDTDFDTARVLYTGNTVTSPGVGVQGPDDAGSDGRFKQINYIPNLGTEVLRFDFCKDGGFNGATVLLSHLYLEYGKIERGSWTAKDDKMNVVGTGTFEADQKLEGSNPGHKTLIIRTKLPFKYLEFSAGTYGIQNRVYEDASDYFVREITPLCVPTSSCDDVLGSANYDWSKALVATKAIDSNDFVLASNNSFRTDWAGVAGSGGLGVPGPDNDQNVRSRFHEINYISEKNQSEKVRIFFGDFFTKAKVTVSRFYGVEGDNQAERGNWTAYRNVQGTWVAVATGEFRASQPYGSNQAGRKTFEINSTEAFEMLEFGVNPYVSNSGRGYADDSDYLLNEIVLLCPVPPVPTCDGCVTANKVVSFKQGKTKAGNAIRSERSNPANALATPQKSDLTTAESNNNFVSLGFGGELVLEFSCILEDKQGFDFEIFETSFGNPTFATYPEKAEVFVSLDGLTWASVGTTQPDKTRPTNANNSADNNGAKFDLANANITKVRYVKIVDISDKTSTRFNSLTDGFDIDGLVCSSNDNGGGGEDDGGQQNFRFASNATPDQPIHYPTIVDDILNIDFSQAYETAVPDRASISVYDIFGKMIQSEDVTFDDTQKATISTSDYTKGIYFVRIQADGQVYSRKIIKK